MPLLHPVLAAVPTLAVAAVYCFWDAYQGFRHRRDRKLRERVAYMLWVMAHGENVLIDAD